MPVYEFKCLDCEKTFTLPLSVRDFERQSYECPNCKKKNLEEQFTSVKCRYLKEELSSSRA
jgi:putative FmdB family regulatory protein